MIILSMAIPPIVLQNRFNSKRMYYNNEMLIRAAEAANLNISEYFFLGFHVLSFSCVSTSVQ